MLFIFLYNCSDYNTVHMLHTVALWEFEYNWYSIAYVLIDEISTSWWNFLNDVYVLYIVLMAEYTSQIIAFIWIEQEEGICTMVVSDDVAINIEICLMLTSLLSYILRNDKLHWSSTPPRLIL